MVLPAHCSEKLTCTLFSVMKGIGQTNIARAQWFWWRKLGRSLPRGNSIIWSVRSVRNPHFGIFGPGNSHISVSLVGPKPIFLVKHQKLGFGASKQTELWVLARPKILKCGHWQYRSGRNAFDHTKYFEMSGLVRPNRPKRAISEGLEWIFFPNFFSRPCHRPELVWSVPVLGRGPHRGLQP